jgi:hypothetical protein
VDRRVGGGIRLLVAALGGAAASALAACGGGDSTGASPDAGSDATVSTDSGDAAMARDAGDAATGRDAADGSIADSSTGDTSFADGSAPDSSGGDSSTSDGAMGDGPTGDASEAGCGSDAGSSVDRSWARWPMPNSATDVDGGAPNPESYTDNGNGTVTDNVTQLMWQQGGGGASWQDAATACANLLLAGHCDWRMPTFIELLSLVDYGRSPAAATSYFPNATGPFWSGTPAGGGSMFAWFINFADGQTNNNVTTLQLGYRCVRGGP